MVQLSNVQTAGNGINRNIVECKSSWLRNRPKHICVLIETLWNVNIRNSLKPRFLSTGINRNIVECKSVQSHVQSHRAQVLIETLWNVNDVGILIDFELESEY